jgi:Uma2 family endonuclease
MSPAVIEKKKFTYEDYLKTPSDQRYELIGGDLIMTPSPMTRHQDILRDLGFELNEFVKQNKLGKISIAPSDVYLDNENVVQPDILFIAKERFSIIGEKNIQGAPDIAVEIISEGSAYRDLVQKKTLYARFGVKEYWIVIPEQETVELYRLKDATFELHKSYTKSDTLETAILPGLQIPLKEIF